MKKGVLFRLSVCLFILGFFMISYIEKQNRITELRIHIPKILRDFKSMQEEIVRLRYEIDHFESPDHLMELARSSEFSHLKHPFTRDVLMVANGDFIVQEKVGLSSKVIASRKPYSCK